MPDHIADGTGGAYPAKVTSGNELLITGEVEVTNIVSVSGNLGVVFDPYDTVNVTPSGNFVVDTNLYPGSESYQGTNPWITNYGNENQRIINSDDAVTTISYVDSNKDNISNLVSSSSVLGRKVTDTFNSSGATTLVISRVVDNV